MRCVNCGKDINDDAASCRYCGHVYDMARAQAEYQKAQAEYQQAQAEYERKMREYNRQMQEYRQQMAQYNSSKQTPQGRKNVDQLQPGMQNNNMNQPYGKNSGGFNSFSGNDNRQNIQNNNNMNRQPGMQNNNMNRQRGMQNNNMNRQGNPNNFGNSNRPQSGVPNNNNNGKNMPPQKKKKTATVIIIIMVLILLALVGTALYLILGPGDGTGSRRKKDNNSASTTDTRAVEVTEDTEEQTETVAGSSCTVLFYMIGSNLESGDSYVNYGVYNSMEGGCATDNLDMLIDADITDDVNVVIQTGGTGYWANDYGMEGDHVQRFQVTDTEFVEKEDLGDVCMCEESTLEDYLKWVKTNYPSDRYILVMWDHGGGMSTTAFGSDTSVNHGDTLEIADMAQAMEAADIKFDMTIFNACLMATVETANALSPYSDYMIASEEVIYSFGYDHQVWLDALCQDPAISSEELGKTVIDGFKANYDEFNSMYSSVNGEYMYGLAMIDTEKASELQTKLNDYFKTADEAIYDKKLQDYLTARNNCGNFSDTQSADIVDFCSNYNLDGGDTVTAAVQDSVVYKQSNITYSNGLSVYLPYGESTSCQIYSYYGRENLETLGEQTNVVTFCDDMLSAYAGYACDGDISALGMDSYYNSKLVEAYKDTYDGYDTASQFDLQYTKEGNSYYLELGDSFSNVSYMEARVGYDYSGDRAVVLGSDINAITWDSSGKVDVTFPSQWLSIDGQIVSYITTYHNTMGNGDVEMQGVIPFVLNGDMEHLYGIVMNSSLSGDRSFPGYTEIDVDTLSFKEDYIYEMYDGMDITFVYPTVEHKGNALDESSVEFVTLGNVHNYKVGTFSVGYKDIDEFKTYLGTFADTAKGYSYVRVVDHFNREYVTDLIPQ